MSQVINSSKTEMSTSSLSETLGGMLTMRASIQMTKPAQCLHLRTLYHNRQSYHDRAVIGIEQSKYT